MRGVPTLEAAAELVFCNHNCCLRQRVWPAEPALSPGRLPVRSAPRNTVLPAPSFNGHMTGFYYGTVNGKTGYVRDVPLWACTQGLCNGCRWCIHTPRYPGTNRATRRHLAREAQRAADAAAERTRRSDAAWIRVLMSLLVTFGSSWMTDLTHDCQKQRMKSFYH